MWALLRHLLAHRDTRRTLDTAMAGLEHGQVRREMHATRLEEAA